MDAPGSTVTDQPKKEAKRANPGKSAKKGTRKNRAAAGKAAKKKLAAKLNKQVRKVPHQQVSAKAVVICGSKILLLRQADGSWDLPGGSVGKGEAITEALVREILEETGLLVGPTKLLTTQIRAKAKQGDILYLSYLCETEGKLKKKHVNLSREHKDFEIFDIDEARNLKMPGRHKKAIQMARKYLRGK